jgi:hypothetical protein
MWLFNIYEQFDLMMPSVIETKKIFAEDVIKKQDAVLKNPMTLQEGAVKVNFKNIGSLCG